MINIRAYHTHIEVYPYKKGDNQKIENMFSLWLDVEHRHDPIGNYIDEKNEKLYLPRGASIYMLEKEFESTGFVIHEHDKAVRMHKCEMTFPPKNRIQKESIDFLTGQGNFKNTRMYSQLSLNLDTGDGKTYCAISSIINLGMKAIIITHADKIKKQWIDTWKNMTSVDSNNLIDISGSDIIKKIMSGKVKGDIYFVNHQTINSYGNTNGWESIRDFFKKICVGIKVIDEAHLEFRNTIRIDMFSDVKKSFYLTANFNRSDPMEDKLFQRCFSTVYKYGEETKNYEEKRKHIIYIPVMYKSNPPYIAETMIRNQYGFSVQGFIDYALGVDESQTMLNTLSRILDMATRLDGKILITCPKIDSVEKVKSFVQGWCNEKTVVSIHSKHTASENEENKNADIIVSTIKSNGTGSDIKGLRCVINLEPFSSSVTANQLSGRLREYAPDKDTYIFDLIDIAFPTCFNQYKSKLPCLKKKCKSVQIMKI